MTFHANYYQIEQNRKAERLARALKETADAHHAYEVSTGHPDADWPTWYAQHLIEMSNTKPSDWHLIPNWNDNKHSNSELLG